MQSSTLLLLFSLISFSLAVNFPTNETQHFGYFQVNDQYGVNLFYWLFESRDKPVTDPLVLWLTGGPGCSGELALFSENGPWTVNTDLTLKTNPFSWNTHANLLYVDQPGGTGFSYVKDHNGYVHNETQVAIEMVSFLTQFFAAYPQYANLPFYITGESYGGHYVSAISRQVQIENQAGTTKINLKGLAIGNGWVDPEIQYAHYADYAYGHGLISKSQEKDAMKPYPQCQKLIQQKKYEQAFDTCSEILSIVLEDAGNINYYDVRKKCTFKPLCYDFSSVSKFLNLPDTKTYLGVGSITWTPCAAAVYPPLEGDFATSYRFDLPFLLTDYRVIIYNGIFDLACNFWGTAAYLDSMDWPGQNDFVKAKNETWTVDGATAGTVRTSGNLDFVAVANAGHLVPYDVPENALDLLTRLLNGTPFAGEDK